MWLAGDGNYLYWKVYLDTNIFIKLIVDVRQGYENMK